MKQLLLDAMTDPVTVVLICICTVLGAITFIGIFAQLVMDLVER